MEWLNTTMTTNVILLTWLASGYLTNFLLIAVLVLIVINMGADKEDNHKHGLIYKEIFKRLEELKR
jgi:asparagine N-glycosylation enzyme membrane subunit Stt3